MDHEDPAGVLIVIGYECRGCFWEKIASALLQDEAENELGT